MVEGFLLFGLRYLSFFSARMHRREPMASIGDRREHGDVKKGASATKPVQFQQCILDPNVFFYYSVIRLVM